MRSFSVLELVVVGAEGGIVDVEAVAFEVGGSSPRLIMSGAVGVVGVRDPEVKGAP